jgi:hypothetical protein
MPMYKGIAVFSETVKTDKRLTEKAEGRGLKGEG